MKKNEKELTSYLRTKILGAWLMVEPPLKAVDLGWVPIIWYWGDSREVGMEKFVTGTVAAGGPREVEYGRAPLH